MTLLIGDATVYTDGEVTRASSGSPDAWLFPALHTGEVNELRFRTDDRTQDYDTLELGIYSDDGGAPGDLLGSGINSDAPESSAWITVRGLAIALTEGIDYWLTVMARGGSGVNYTTATPIGDGGTAEVYYGDGDPLTLPATWPVGGDIYDDGPLGFQGLSTNRPSDLVWHVTGLWYPGDTSVAYYGQIVDPSNDGYIDTLNDQSTGEVTFDIGAQDPALVSNLIGKAYARFLKVYDGGRLAFWGPYKLGSVDFAAGTCTLSCVDPSLRLSRHVLRRGDLLGTLNAANNDKGSVSVDHIGLRQLRDAGKNSTEQTAEGYPDLGIDDGDNDYDEFPFNKMGVQRLDQVFNQMQQLSQSLGPDFSFRPVEDVVGAYALLDTFVHQGEDLSATVVFHIGTGVQNLENLVVTEGAKYTTHIHVLPRDLSVRFTQANPAAAAQTGTYVDADATDYDSKGIDPDKVEDVLRAYGDDYLKAYGRPLIEVVLTLPVDRPGVPRYGVDFNKGDTVGVAGRLKGPGGETLWDLPPAPYRITSVRRRRDGEGIRSEITVVGDMVAAAGDAVATAGAGDES